MRRRLAIWVTAVGVAAVGIMASVGDVAATPPSGFTGTTVGFGRFDDISVFNHELTAITEGDSNPQQKVWLSQQKTKGPSDLFVQNNVWQPGGSTGWHTHPGHSLIIVTAGQVTAYEGDAGECHQRVYTVGMGLVDPGGDHVHLLRNEGTVEARTMAVQLIPAGFARRIDAQAPAACNVF